MSSSSSAPTKLLYSVGIGLGVAVVSSVSYWLYKVWKQNLMPQKWRPVGTLAQINIFPIKSCAPLKLDPETVLTCDVLGLRIESFRDRCLMLIDGDNKMITARGYPKMVLIEPQMVTSTKILITAPGMSSVLELDFSTLVDEAPGKDVRTSVWGTDIDVMLCGENYDTWFSKVILEKDSGLRLVYYPYPSPVRSINARMAKEPFITRQDTGTFNDATSYMLMNLSSVADLNTRLNNPVYPLQFRGNFHLKMDVDEPYAEDKWGWIKIGANSVFRKVSPCTRCIFTNINPFTGERDSDGQPLKILNKYRKWVQYPSPVMGIHLGIRQSGDIKANDVIYVEEN